MRIIVTSILAAVVLAIGAGLILHRMQKPVYQVDAMSTVRISDPGTNLVGPDWSGLPKVARNKGEPAQASNDRG
jgi:hypothetical protein